MTINMDNLCNISKRNFYASLTFFPYHCNDNTCLIFTKLILIALRILQLIQKTQLRGAEIFACQLAVQLKKRGCIVDVVYLLDSSTTLSDFDLQFIPLHANLEARFLDIGAFRRLAKIVNDGMYDIVQANASDTLKYAVFSKFLFCWNAKLIFRNASHMSDFIRGRIHLIFNRWLLSRCQFIISVSENCRLDLIELFPPAAHVSVTIPIGTTDFNEIPAVFGKEFQKEPVFVNIGSFVPEKNHKFLLEVFRLYHQRNGHGLLWLVGDGKLKPALEEKIEQFGLKGNVRFWGYRTDVISILKSADILIMPSLIEGLPGAILEAISCGIPVIASAVGGIPEVVENNVTGICIREWSIDQYVNAIDGLLADPEFKGRLVKQAKTKLLERFTIETVSGAFLAQYKSLVNCQRFA